MQNSAGPISRVIGRLQGSLWYPFQAALWAYRGTAHWAFMIAICFWEASFSYKSYDLSYCYRLYISSKNNIGKALNYHADLSDLYQLYISCKNNIETSI